MSFADPFLPQRLAYKALLGQDLAHVVRGELSSKTERLFVMALAVRCDLFLSNFAAAD